MRKLRAPKRTPLKPLYPSPAVGVAYERALGAAVDAMTDDVTALIVRRAAPLLAMDAMTPAGRARVSFRKVALRWQAKFDALAPRLSRYFADSAQRAVDGSLKAMLREAGFTVRMTISPGQQGVLDAVIGENVALIRSVASQYLSAIEGAVMRSVAKGGDLGGLTEELVQTTGITKRRAANIARSQNRMATAVLANKRYEEMGLDEASWLHSAGGKEPRPEHVAFSGKTYKIARGAYLEGKWTYPGIEPGCKCVSRAVIPGYDD